MKKILILFGFTGFVFSSCQKQAPKETITYVSKLSRDMQWQKNQEWTLVSISSFKPNEPEPKDVFGNSVVIGQWYAFNQNQKSLFPIQDKKDLDFQTQVGSIHYSLEDGVIKVTSGVSTVFMQAKIVLLDSGVVFTPNLNQRIL